MEHEIRKEINKFKDLLKENSEEKLNISDVRKSSPLKEGWTKSNIKNNTQTRRLAPPPPPQPIKR